MLFVPNLFIAKYFSIDLAEKYFLFLKYLHVESFIITFILGFLKKQINIIRFLFLGIPYKTRTGIKQELVQLVIWYVSKLVWRISPRHLMQLRNTNNTYVKTIKVMQILSDVCHITFIHIRVFRIRLIIKLTTPNTTFYNFLWFVTTNNDVIYHKIVSFPFYCIH